MSDVDFVGVVGVAEIEDFIYFWDVTEVQSVSYE